MPLKSGGAVDNEYMRGRSNQGLVAIGKVVVVAGNLYAGLNTSPGKIVKIDLATFTKTSTLTLDTGEDYVVRSVVSGNYLYAGLQTAPCKVVKIDLATFTKVATLEFSPDLSGNIIWDLAINGNYLYACLGVSNRRGELWKIDLTTFSVADHFYFLNAGENDSSGLAISGNFLYCSLWTPNPGKIVKVDLTTFTEVSTLTLALDENHLMRLNIKDNYLYVDLQRVPGQIVKVDLTTFTKVDTLTMAADENEPWSQAISGNNLYALLRTAPAKVVKVDLATFTKVSTLTFDAGEDLGFGLAAFGKFLYAGCVIVFDHPPSKIVKVNLDTFTKVSTLTLDAGEDSVYDLLAS